MAELLEREAALALLTNAFAAASSGSGRTVLVSGEAGIGKTSLVARFIQPLEGRARVFVGGCEALFSPRPLGPLYDIAMRLPARTRDLLGEEGRRAELFAAVLAAFDGPTPAVMVIEDVHWADASTLDLIKYLGRRLTRIRMLLIVTYRDDELNDRHPLRRVLGDLPATSLARVPLPPLSVETVHRLAEKHGRSGPGLYAASGGNPFFVNELLREEGIPASVVDAVLARAARQSDAVRNLLELAAIVPARIERGVVDAILRPSDAAVSAALASGLLREDGDGLAYRHELARIAVEQALPASTSRSLHARVVAALESGTIENVPSTRLVHHANKAGMSEAVLHHARHAAAEAIAHAAYREAATLLRTALEHARSLSPGERAALLEDLAYQCYLTEQIDDAIDARKQALAIWRTQGETRREGTALRWLSRLSWFRGDNDAAERHADEAIALLEQLPAGRELAWAYTNRAQLDMLAERNAVAIEWGSRAIRIASEIDDPEILAHALNNIGTAQYHAGTVAAAETLERSLAIAKAHCLDEHVSRAYTNLTSQLVLVRDYARATRFFDEATAYFCDRDLDSWSNYIAAWRARQALETGDWSMADELASQLVARARSVIVRIPALAVLGRLRSRRGDSGADTLVAEALSLASRTGELQRLGPVVALEAEHDWLQCGPARPASALLVSTYALACERGNARWIGELGYWLQKKGALATPDPRAELPYALQAAGRWREAAYAWEVLRCPWDRALALLDGDESAKLEALAIAESLGASAGAAAFREHLRRSGARRVPRGPRASTSANPVGLTAREMQVLSLLAQGLANAEIAQRLVRSEKTVDHHVSAILAKLSVRSRTEAVVIAHRLGLTTPA